MGDAVVMRTQDLDGPAIGARVLCDNWMWEDPLRDNIKRGIATLAGLRVLDLGCGPGYISEFMASAGAKVIGIDIKESKTWKNRKHAPSFLLSRGERLPFQDDSFDLVLSCTTLQYMDKDATYAELIRVTKDRGVLLLHENMPHNPVIIVYRWVRIIRAQFSPGLKQYTDMIRGYVSPFDRFPSQMILKRFSCYYFLSALNLAICDEGMGKVRSTIGKALFFVDGRLLSWFPGLQKWCWFSSYHFVLSKHQPKV